MFFFYFLLNPRRLRLALPTVGPPDSDGEKSPRFILLRASWPTGWQEFTNPDTASEELVRYVAGNVMAYIYTAMYTLSSVCGFLAIQTSGTRILYSMGRDNILPKKVFGYVHPKFKTPSRCVALTTVIYIIAAIVVDLAAISSVVNFGALIAFMMVNICVIVHFFIKEKKRNSFRDVLRYFVAPSIGTLVCLFVFVNLDPMALILGGSWTVIGFIYLLIMTKGFKQLPKEMNLDENVEIE